MSTKNKFSDGQSIKPRGRPKADNPASVRLNGRVTPEWKTLLGLLAKHWGVSENAAIIRAVEQAAEAQGISQEAVKKS